MPERQFAVMVLWVLAGLALGGCATHHGSLSDLPDQELVGHYVGGQGESWFHPCGAKLAEPRPWVTFTGDSIAQVEREKAAGRFVPGQRYFVRWRTAITTGGEVGPQGQGVPALLVRELLEIHPAAEGDCAENDRSS